MPCLANGKGAHPRLPPPDAVTTDHSPAPEPGRGPRSRSRLRAPAAVLPRKQPGQGGPNQGGRERHTQTPGLPTGAPAHGKGVCASTTTPSVAPLSNSSSPPWGTLEIELQGSPFPAWACMTFGPRHDEFEYDMLVGGSNSDKLDLGSRTPSS